MAFSSKWHNLVLSYRDYLRSMRGMLFHIAGGVCYRDLIKSGHHHKGSLSGCCFQADTSRISQNFPTWELGGQGLRLRNSTCDRKQPRVSEGVVGMVYNLALERQAEGSNHAEPQGLCSCVLS